ncbi:hypothetical protein D9R06_01210 [Kocuria marina subsp. indica]|nr:hypothetical protein B1B07_00705 [Kocuria indica]RLP59472.1 hypothetical protein D9R06_01210 [Kocuria indica]
MICGDGVGDALGVALGVGEGVTVGVSVAKFAGSSSDEPDRPVKATAPTPTRTSRAAPPSATGAMYRRTPERAGVAVPSGD